MNRTDKRQIREALVKFGQTSDLRMACTTLLDVLGYSIERTLEHDGSPEGFIKVFEPQDGYSTGTKSEKALIKAAREIRFILQITGKEIATEAQGSLIKDGKVFESGTIKSFAFVGVALKDGRYRRTDLANFTREINKRFKMPTVVLYRYHEQDTEGKKLTIAFPNRRLSKKKIAEDVLLKVTLLRSINAEKPHRAHVDILFELSLYQRLKWASKTRKPPIKFEDLFAAWLDELDSETLVKDFYEQLNKWFERAIGKRDKNKGYEVHHPDPSMKEEFVLRTLTRLFFVWFIKEKGLIHDDLFEKREIEKILNNYTDEGTSYYRVILQNLFFATLNTPIPERRFSNKNRADHRNFAVYRYKDEMASADVAKRLHEVLFVKTPFINGGLFDCLDDFRAKGEGGQRIDYFSDKEGHLISVPNRLFFDDEHGLIKLFNRYKFTVEENTPIEQEAALDPELLGTVFEKLSRKRHDTGSYYTPREIVAYIVSESLIASLTKRCSNGKDVDKWQHSLRRLLDPGIDYEEHPNDDPPPNFTQEVIDALSDTKIIDPAAGSGAFLMGALQLMTLARRRLGSGGTASDSEYQRKFSLIQNNIYGVDIQPMACQIAKLRFFISLAIEQEPTEEQADNYGIEPLPNLETKLVAADSLRPLLGSKRLLPETSIQSAVADIRENQEKYYRTADRSLKLKIARDSDKLRANLATALKQVWKDGVPGDDLSQLARWKYDDTNASAPWFDPSWMFGLEDPTFDIVIGNPPYKRMPDVELRNQYTGYETFVKSGDIYCLFYELGHKLLNSHGHLCYIASSSWMRNQFGEKLRKYFATKTQPRELIELGPGVFEAAVNTSILLLESGKQNQPMTASSISYKKNRFAELARSRLTMPVPPEEERWLIYGAIGAAIKKKIDSANTKPLKEWDISINYGIKTGRNASFIIDNATKQELERQEPNSAKLIEPLFKGEDIQRFHTPQSNRWLIASHNGYGSTPRIDIDDYPAIKAHLDEDFAALKARADQGATPYNLRNCDYYGKFDGTKIVFPEVTGGARFTLDDAGRYVEKTAFIMTGNNLKYLCGILNSAPAANFFRWYYAGVRLNEEGFLYQKNSLLEFPIPVAPKAAHKQVVGLVDKIISLKDSDMSADTEELEVKLDEIVAELYGLSSQELEHARNPSPLS